MNLNDSVGIKRLKPLLTLLATSQPEPRRRAERVVAMQLHIVLPAKAGVILVVFYFLWRAGWFDPDPEKVQIARTAYMEMLKTFFYIYIFSNAVGLFVFLFWRRFPAVIFEWFVFMLGLLDGLFAAGIVFITRGFESIAFWVFPGLIVLNAVSISLATPQITLNLMLSVFYLGAGILDARTPEEEKAFWGVPKPSSSRQMAALRRATEARAGITNANSEMPSHARRPLWPENDNVKVEPAEDVSPQTVVLHMSVLWLLTVCCYGVQVLAERQQRVIEEEREFAVREAQLRSAGRLAAEFAHQIKNPLAIINNAAYSLQRALKAGRNDVSQQIQIIQEEVERSDKIVTQIMGYAQLTEGRVEKLNVAEELDRAIAQVFPPAVDTGIRVERNYVVSFPPLLMQRRHFSEVLVNLLQNAREAMGTTGVVSVTAVCRPDFSLEVSIRDTGPGIPPDKLEKIFEAYYTTKEKGTGLGLAILKHNVELYTGTVRVESELGKGARFTLTFPAKTVISPAKQT